MLETIPQTQNVRLAEDAPTVSVIIPAYKVSPFIGETLDSVLAQTFTDYEIIIINDGSPDTAELEQALEKYRDSVVYLKQKNLGAGAARNTGLRAARGRFVAFLDGDDLWSPNFLSEQIKFIQSDGGYDLVYANALHFGNSPLAGRTYMETDPSEGEVTVEALLGERCLVNTSTVVARREPILEIGLFDEGLPNSQDFDLWVRLAKRDNARLNYQRKVLAQHRHHSASLASSPIKSLEGQLRVLAKVSQRDDLTANERAALNRTVALRSASVEIDRGKVRLLDGEFAAAAKSFKYANDYFHSWKLRVVLLWLRVAPGTLQRLYRLRVS